MKTKKDYLFERLMIAFEDFVNELVLDATSRQSVDNNRQVGRIMNFNEVSRFTGLSKGYLYKLTSTNSIPCYKPHGGRIYFVYQEIEEWLLQNKKASK